MRSLLPPVLNWKNHCKRWFLALMLGVLILPLMVTPAYATGVYQLPKPAPGTWVVDMAEVVSRITENTVNSSLGNLAKQTGQEVHFVTIRRLDYGETIETFTHSLFEKWFPTAEEQADQTLIVLDSLTNDSAIRVGESAKALLSDDIAQSVAQETVLYPLKQGEKYNQAFLDASTRLTAVLSGQADPGAPKLPEVQTEGTFATREETQSSNALVWVFGLLAAATIIPMATYYLYVYLQSR